MEFSEHRFLQWLRLQISAMHPSADVDFSDDAAVLLPSHENTVVTSDMLMEMCDFSHAPSVGFRKIGFKAVAVNISDLAAKAAAPQWVTVSFAWPRQYRLEDAMEMYEGIFDACSHFSCRLIGGDTNVWDGPLTLSVTAGGTAHKKGTPRRSDAREGDIVIVSGPLGGSIFGRHLLPQPRVDMARVLLDEWPIHAMTDISDGVASELRHIASASGLSAVIETKQLPLHKDLVQNSQHHMPFWEHALRDGEDFELLFTMSADHWSSLAADVMRKNQSAPYAAIGYMVAQVDKDTPLLIDAGDGRDPMPYKAFGFEHK